MGDWFAAVLVLLLSLYGCVQLIRRVCLWATRCPRAVKCYCLAVPQTQAAVAPLFRCLQAQAAWADIDAERTLVLLPPGDEPARQLVERLAAEHPAVQAVTTEELVTLVTDMH